MHSEKPKERALSEEEIKILWKNLDGDDVIISQEIIQALKLTLVNAQRPGEVIGLHVREIKGKWWTIPSERAKNGRTHRVFLTDLALEIIASAKKDGYLFPSPKNIDKPIGEKSMPCALRRNIKGQAYQGRLPERHIKNYLKIQIDLGSRAFHSSRFEANRCQPHGSGRCPL